MAGPPVVNLMALALTTRQLSMRVSLAERGGGGNDRLAAPVATAAADAAGSFSHALHALVHNLG